MRGVLLVTDLEGVAGVDSVGALLASSPEYARARELLMGEVLSTVRGFRDAGYERIVVSDSHRPGADVPNLDAARLPAGVILDWRDDAYAADLFDGMDAVACLGMHAAAGTRGFAAHTVHVHCAWTAAGKNLSEIDIILGLAAERGVPVVFVSGDDVLERDDVRYVRTKTADGVGRARSLPHDEVCAALRAAARATPAPAPRLPEGPWALAFKSNWQTRLAGELVAHGPTVRARYDRGLEILKRTEPPLALAWRATALAEDVARELERPFARHPPPAHPEAASRALAAFLRVTDGEAWWQAPQRALILHMLEAWAPAFFGEAGLAAVLADALVRLAPVPGEITRDLDSFQAMARVDAVYVRACRGLPHAGLPGLLAYVRAHGDAHLLPCWLMWEMARQIGLAHPVAFPRRPLRERSRVADLYWLTHQFFLATRYLHAPFDPRGWEAEIEEVLLAAPFALAERRLDLAAELALCLALAGEDDSAEHAALLAALVTAQDQAGVVRDPSVTADGRADEHDAHSTAVALLALARY